VAWALVARKYTDSIMPFRDAFIAAYSVAAQVLQSRKQIENWAVLDRGQLRGGRLVLARWTLLHGLFSTRSTWAMVVRRLAGMAEKPGRKLRPYEWAATRRRLRAGVTGKTRLAEKLAAHFGAPLVPEYAREFWDRHGLITLRTSPASRGEQWRREDKVAAAATRLLICDTEALTTVVVERPALRDRARTTSDAARKKRATGYALYLLLDIDVPFNARSPAVVSRTRPTARNCQRIWRGALERRHLPFVDIRGDWAAREAAAVAAVAALG